MFLLYKAKENNDVIGYLQQSLPIQELVPSPVEGEPAQAQVVVKLVIAWVGFDANTGEISPTPEGYASTTLENPDDLICLGSEEEFLSNYADDGDDDEDEDEDNADQPSSPQ